MHLIKMLGAVLLCWRISKFVCVAVLMLYWIKDKQFAVVINLWRIRQQPLNDSKQRS